MKLKGIEDALKSGLRLHAFRSGGGLRVIRLEKNGVLKGYGEHPQVEDALSHAEEDFLAGGRPYDKVYGGSKPHYLTGSSKPTSNLDQWLLQGYTFDAWHDDQGFVFKLKGWVHVEAPKEIHESVLASGKAETWEDPRGFLYRISRSKFPNGEPCTSMQVVKSPKKEKAGSDFMYEATKTGRGATFWEAMENAFQAEEVEMRA